MVRGRVEAEYRINTTGVVKAARMLTWIFKLFMKNVTAQE